MKHKPAAAVVEITVETLGGLGDGIANHKGKPIFIPKACAGDVLNVRIVNETKEAFQATIVDVLTPGPHRQTAPCKHFAECGGCALQQLAPEHYKAFKTRLLQSALARAGYDIPAEVIFLTTGTRRRAEFKIEHENNRINLAFVEPRSHETIAIHQCPVLASELQALIGLLNRALSTTPYAAHLVAVSFTLADTGVDMVLTLAGYKVEPLPGIEELCKNLNLARISVRTPDSKPQVATKLANVQMQLGKYSIAIPPDAFLQATAEGQKRLTETAINTTKSAKKVADLFSGIGTYSFPLSEHTHVHAVEGDTTMMGGIRNNITRHSIKTLTVEQRDLFKNPMTPKDLDGFDAAIINPPRVGAKAQVEQLAASGVNTIVMISCNPATFTRDAAILKNAGFSISSAYGIDQFVWSAHLEIVAVFTR